jgi:hypothetical protein
MSSSSLKPAAADLSPVSASASASASTASPSSSPSKPLSSAAPPFVPGGVAASSTGNRAVTGAGMGRSTPTAPTAAASAASAALLSDAYGGFEAAAAGSAKQHQDEDDADNGNRRLQRDPYARKCVTFDLYISLCLVGSWSQITSRDLSCLIFAIACEGFQSIYV